MQLPCPQNDLQEVGEYRRPLCDHFATTCIFVADKRGVTDVLADEIVKLKGGGTICITYTNQWHTCEL